MEEFANPQKILNQLHLQSDMVAADFGSGSGGWVLPLAKQLEEGKVFAIDVLEEPLSALKSKARAEKISNIETIIADVEKPVPLADGLCGLILMTDLLFEVDDKKAVLAQGKRVLGSGGRILVVDWAKDNPLTKQIERVSFEEIKNISREIGLEPEKEFEAGIYHYALVLTKP